MASRTSATAAAEMPPVGHPAALDQSTLSRVAAGRSRDREVGPRVTASSRRRPSPHGDGSDSQGGAGLQADDSSPQAPAADAPALIAGSPASAQEQSQAYLPPVALDRPAEIPLSHMIDDETAANVAPQVPVESLERIRESFEAEVAQGNYPVDHPQYEFQWKRAQMTAAQRVKSLYGDAAYASFQRELFFQQLEAKSKESGD